MGCEVEDLERLEVAKRRFLDSNLKEVVVTNGMKQMRIQIWSWLEITAMELVKDQAEEVVEEENRKEEVEM